MLLETKKLHIIEEVLKIKNDAILLDIEAFVSKATQAKVAVNFDAKTFSGIWTNEEADEISKIIEEACENINPDDWK